MTVRFTDEEFQKMLTLIKTKQHGSFANFHHHYDGARDAEKIEAFILAARGYKVKQFIDPAMELNSLSMILKGDAAKWWKDVNKEIKTWSEFETALRDAFKPKREGYLVYQDIFSVKQLDNLSTNDFIAKKRALFALLTPPLDEGVQLDMMYSLLNINIQKKVPRESFRTYAEFLELAKKAEESPDKGSETGQKQKVKKIRCSFCRKYGHTVDICRKKMAVKDLEKETEFSNFSLHVRRRPTINISVGEINETGFLDTGAGMSFASFKFYQALLKKGFEFTDESLTYSLADGVEKTEMFLTVTVPVGLQGRIIPTKFMVFLESRENATLLGVKFMRDAGMVLDIPQLAWYFNDEPNIIYDIQEEEDGDETAELQHCTNNK